MFINSPSVEITTLLFFISCIATLAVAIASLPSISCAITKQISHLLLKSDLPSPDNIVIKDIFIKSHKTRADHLILSSKGIFAVKVVYAQGVVLGAPDSEAWKDISVGVKTIRNPLIDLETLSKHISNKLGVARSEIHSLVLFSGGGQAHHGTTSVDEIIYGADCIVRIIQSKERPNVFDRSRIEEMSRIMEASYTH